MVKKELKVCDICEERIFKENCGICGADLCSTCSKKLPLITLSNCIVITKVCKKCLQKTNDLIKDPRFTEQFITNFGKLVQSSSILKELEEEEEEEN